VAIAPAKREPTAASAPASGKKLSQRAFRRVCGVIYDHAKISLDQRKFELVESRLAKRLHLTGCDSYEAYLERYITPPSGSPDAGEFEQFVNCLSTNLTSFFREPGHFEHLAETFLVEHRRRHGQRVRGWCAGCSSGEEAYTLAMTLDQAMSARSDRLLLATDISTRVLSTATAGVYPIARCQGLSPQLRGQYFEPRVLSDGSPALAARSLLRDRIRFRHLNLMSRWPFGGPFDFIFCRNVMIYFDKPTQEALVRQFSAVLRPGGLLYTGHSESLTSVRHELQFVGASIYRKP
jgi:chemotaxis protein methyltransferase CheR